MYVFSRRNSDNWVDQMDPCCMISWVWLLATSVLLLRKMKFRQRLNKAKPLFPMIKYNPNGRLGSLHWPLYTRRIDVEDDYHKKNEHVCMLSCGVQLLGESSQYLYQCCQTKSAHSIKDFWQHSSSSTCYSNWYKNEFNRSDTACFISGINRSISDKKKGSEEVN